MTTKSISKMKSDFCEMWRRQRSDEDFLQFVGSLLKEYPRDSRDENRMVRLREFFEMKPGEQYYDINTDCWMELVE